MSDASADAERAAEGHQLVTVPSNYRKAAIRASELQKLIGMPRQQAMALVMQVLDRAGISTVRPKDILFERRGNDAFFAGPPHSG